MRGRFVLLMAGLLGVATALLAAPASASAAPTEHGVIVFPVAVFQDSEVCAAEGFTVDVVERETLRFQTRFDRDGQVASVLAHHDISFEISANAKTIFESDHYNNTFAPDGTSTASGVQTHILNADGGVVLIDAGRIVFDANNNPTFIAGPHPQFLGATFCAALMP